MFLREVYIPAHNARFAIKAEQEGTAFVIAKGVELGEILCVQEEREVGNDNCVSFNRLKLQIPESPLRAHFVKARVKVRHYHDGAQPFSSGRAASADTTGRQTRRGPHRRLNPLGGWPVDGGDKSHDLPTSNPTAFTDPIRAGHSCRHCEERSDAAIQPSRLAGLDCFASLAMMEKAKP